MNNISEELTKTLHDTQFARDSLREALSKSNATEAIVLVDLIKRTAELERDIGALKQAHDIDREK